jgi:ribosomal protein L14E/L6E/L27E
MRKRMDTNQNNSPTAIDENKYLVTEKAQVNEFSKSKINNDLEAIKKAELRSKKQIDITMGKRESEVTRAMDALGLTNPFKGV